MSDTLTYRGIASEAVFTEPPVVGEFSPACYPYCYVHIAIRFLLIIRNNGAKICASYRK